MPALDRLSTVRRSCHTVLAARVIANEGGGPERLVFALPRFLSSYGYDVICAYMHPADDRGFSVAARAAAEQGVILHSIPDRGPLDVRVIRQLFALCRERRVVIWHAHDYKAAVLGYVLRRWWPMVLVSTVQGWGDVSPKLRVYSGLERRCLRSYAKVMCVSEALRTQCISSGVPADHCVVIPNGVDLARYVRTISLADAKRRLGFSPDRLLVGCVARLAPEKNLALLVTAIDELISRGVKCDLVIAGEGPERGRLESLIRSRAHFCHLHVLGHRSDVVALYQAMDIFVLPSLREGLPLALLEAMSCGVPVVASHVGGVPQLVSHGTNGFLFESQRQEDLAAAVARLAEDGALRRTLGENGRRTVEARFDVSASVKQIRSVYDETLERSTASARTGSG
jgi:glycosyltransferase involved in cell wall biosynthesis